MEKFAFWFSFVMIFYAYFGYLICLLIILAFKKLIKYFALKEPQLNTVDSDKNILDQQLPSVSFIIAAYNEEKRIEEKLKNTILIKYPNDKIEILVASDCSTDSTDEIVKSYSSENIKLVRAPERKGKENAQLHAVQRAKGEILVFSDVATILEPNAILQIVSNFKEPNIGCVSSEDRFIDKEGKCSSGEGLYVKYEMLIRKLESRVNTLVGLSGSFFAARRDVCQDWAPDLQSDFNTLLNTIKLGKKGVSDPKSIGYYENIEDEKKEFQRKVRTVLRGITVLKKKLYLLNPAHYGLFSWQLFSHKVCRWLVPFFLLIMFLANILALPCGFLYILIFISQLVFYFSAIFYFVKLKRDNVFNKQNCITDEHDNMNFKTLKKIIWIGFQKLSRISFYFTLVNLSILIAWIKYFQGERATFWQPSRR